MSYEPNTHVDPLGTVFTPTVDAMPEQCPSCRAKIDAWSVETARFEGSLCACQACGAMVAA